jgi:hypothetical protein
MLPLKRLPFTGLSNGWRMGFSFWLRTVRDRLVAAQIALIDAAHHCPASAL